MVWIPESVGWAATALFGVSYFFKDSNATRKVQALAAAVWAGYGILIHSLPVIVANIIVLTLALFTAWRQRRVETRD
jgi:hypothetical protein